MSHTIPLSWLFWIALAMFLIGAMAAVAFVPRLQDKLIPEWRQALRMDTVRAATLLASLSFLQAEVLPLLEAAVPPQIWPYVTAAFAVAIGLLRLRSQPAVQQTKDQA